MKTIPVHEENILLWNLRRLLPRFLHLDSVPTAGSDKFITSEVVQQALASLAEVSRSGSYEDLQDKPIIVTDNNDLDDLTDPGVYLIKQERTSQHGVNYAYQIVIVDSTLTSNNVTIIQHDLKSLKTRTGYRQSVSNINWGDWTDTHTVEYDDILNVPLQVVSYDDIDQVTGDGFYLAYISVDTISRTSKSYHLIVCTHDINKVNLNRLYKQYDIINNLYRTGTSSGATSVTWGEWESYVTELNSVSIVTSNDATSIVKLTQAEYDALTNKSDTTLYIITE